MFHGDTIGPASWLSETHGFSRGPMTTVQEPRQPGSTGAAPRPPVLSRQADGRPLRRQAITTRSDDHEWNERNLLVVNGFAFRGSRRLLQHPSGRCVSVCEGRELRMQPIQFASCADCKARNW